MSPESLYSLWKSIWQWNFWRSEFWFQKQMTTPLCIMKIFFLSLQIRFQIQLQNRSVWQLVQKWNIKRNIWIICRSSFLTDWRTKVSSFKISKEEALSFNQGWSLIEMKMNLCKMEFYFSFNRLDEISLFLSE